MLVLTFWFGTALLTRGQSPPDKSGVKPNVISLPSGAGSIEGLGESFEPHLNSGGSTYGMPIALPPGRAGLAPSIRLDYNSNTGNGVCGIGWALESLSIKRQTDKGFPEYNSGDTFVFQGEELVPLSGQGEDWRCENERGFQRLRRIDSDADGAADAWEVTERNGTRHTLGRFRGQNNRWSVVEHPEKGAQGAFDRTYCWVVDTTTDLHGNRIEYEYTLRTGILYPSRITYGHLAGAVHEIIFEYEERPDVFEDYRPTFSARLDHRLRRIEVRSQGQLVRAYNLAYSYQPGDLLPDVAAVQATYLDLGVTLLKRVVQLDRTGTDANYLPPLIFVYSGLDLTKAEQRAFASPPELDLAEPNGRVQLADLDGDALPDLFATSAEGAAAVQRVCLNRGETRASGAPKIVFAPSKQVIGSSPVDLAEPNTVIHDPKGKGLVDISTLSDDGPNKRLETFGNRARLDVVNEERLGFNQEFFEAATLENPPSFVSYNQVRTRQVDINFDKRGDFVNLEPSLGAMKVNTFYLARGGRWAVGESILPPSYPIANTFEGADGQPNPRVHLADMNGDRLLDLVCLTPQPGGGGQRITVSYWALCGLGRYAEERTVPPAASDTFDLGEADLRDVMIDDFTGDGLADIIVLTAGPQSVLTLRVNIAGQRWSSPYVRSGLPRYAPRDQTSPTVLRFADLNANGSLDLVFRNTSPQSSWDYIELLPAGTPSLLVQTDNSLGKRTSIVYGSAAEDEQQAREAGHPWRTFAPVALQVVRRIRTAGGQDLNGDGHEDVVVAEFRYRDPYYDGFEREFRGFAFAQRIDYGDDFLFDPVSGLMNVSSGWNPARTPTGQLSGPSLVTRYRFHTGAADQTDNDDYGAVPPIMRLIDELTEKAGREEEVLKGLQWIQETVDPVVLHSAPDGGFDAGCEAATTASTPEARGKLTPDAYVYTRASQEWTVRRLYRSTEALPYFADQDANGVLEDYQLLPVAPTPPGRFEARGTTVVPGNGRSVSFAIVGKVTTEVREANGLLADALGYPLHAAIRTMRSFDYDDYGNPTALREFGIDGGTIDDERFMITTYAHGGNALSLWVIDRPDTVNVTDENGGFVARKSHFYDGAAFEGAQGQIEHRALLSRTVEYASTNRTIQATRSKFDAHGNIIETRDPVGNVRQITWDPVFQTYPITETIVVGGGAPDLAINVAYDTGFGLVTNSTDFNGNLTTYHYDSFARLVKIVRPGDTVALPTLTFEYQPADPIRGRAFVYDSAGNLTVSAVPVGSLSRVTTRQLEISGQPGEYVRFVFSDGSGNSIANVEEGETAGTWIVKQATSYNLRRKPQSQWLPFQISSAGIPQFTALWPAGRPPATDGVNPAIVSSDIFYDAAGREIRTVAPLETWGGARRESAVQYLPFQKRLFDEEDLRSSSPHFGTPHVHSFDGLNRLLTVEELVKINDAGLAGPLTNWVTEYRYDLNDQLTRIKDSQGNIRTMAFDGLKRMTNISDPNRGQLIFVYDDASNVRQTVDAKDQRIVFTYDGINRIKTEDYQDGGPLGFDVEYFYDLPRSDLDLGDGTKGTASNTKGQLAFVRDLSGETHLSYDFRGRTEWEVKRIPDRLHGQLISYRTRFAYDGADRLEVLTFPDGDQLQHSYNTRNLLSRIHGATLGDVIGAITYRPSGQPFNIRYGNLTVTSHEYDPRLRLTRLQTTNRESARLIDFAYAFDGASNVERIEDQRNLTGLPEAAQRFNTQILNYDSLYRLSRVEYPRLGTATTNHVAYRYDRIGNMLEQASDIIHDENGLPMANLGALDSGGTAGRFNRSGRNRGEPAGPHALTSITRSQSASRHYEYDDNGNMTSLDGLSCKWDFKDRLVGVENEQMRAIYDYDYADRRTTKTIHWKHAGPDKGTAVSSLNPAWRVTTTHYVNRYFEVREHDALVKYVWNGQTRVARVTGTFGAASRIQHLRLQEGWNHVCLTVGGQFPVLAPENNSDIGACAYWSETAGGNGLVAVTVSNSLPAGSVLWIYARRDMTVILVGTPAPQALPNLTGDSQFVGNVLAEPVDVSSVFPTNAWVARFLSDASAWRYRFPAGSGLTVLNNVPNWLLPGDAVWTTSGTAGPIGTEGNALQVRYYHQDHLGSTSTTTGQNGQLLEETANYPFGQSRHRYLLGASIEPYSFTQKERDEESELSYFEARFCYTRLGRFLSHDPFHKANIDKLVSRPSKLNPYGYALNNPLKYVDPSGLTDEAATQGPATTSTSGESTQTKTGAETATSQTTTDAAATTKAELVISVTGEQTGKDGVKMGTGTYTLTKSDGTADTGYIMIPADKIYTTTDDPAEATKNSGANRTSGDNSPMEVIRLDSEKKNQRYRDIHKGNEAKNTAGCWLVGKDAPKNAFLGSSQKAFDIIYKAFEKGGVVTITDDRSTPATPQEQPVAP